MSDDEFRTTRLHLLLDRMCGGDRLAGDELFRAVGVRLERLARSMLRRYPGVDRWEQTGDLLQNALVRLLRALESCRPESVRSFFNLAAEQMRRELIDLARHYQGPMGPGANHASNGRSGFREPVALAEVPEEMERWCALHEAVRALPPEEREVFELRFYHGFAERETASLVGVDERTVRRRWKRASLALNDALGAAWPDDARKP